ncbi:uncharacterized protein LOC126578812 [Anopheles aquasalis]|uniref:uncharacterized protein LOC126578811 n=1 Tax=Anopheles aquasalis TaxID=42839 RepID=UPI00215B5A05|nr:uncharacterized protein LOC126578811 [Anopheles aquasalis]XP_050097692.1 uncharacterized protein LOC126578812 [Anopheles aquasalis]
MFKVVCLLALVAVVAAMPNGAPASGFQGSVPMGNAPPGRIMKEEAPASNQPAPEQSNGDELVSAAEGKDDMDKSETFGFGYHYYYPRYYGGYHYPSYHYPSYYYRYYPSYYSYGHYW